MTIWNTDTGTKVSRFTFIETILGFAFDPFKAETLVCESEISSVRFRLKKILNSVCILSVVLPMHGRTHTHVLCTVVMS